MAEFEALEVLKESTPVTKSIIDQTDLLLEDDEIANLTVYNAEKKDVEIEEQQSIEDTLSKDVVDDVLNLTAYKEDKKTSKTNENNIDEFSAYNRNLEFKEEESDYDFFRLHPAGDTADDLPEVFQQEFANYYFSGISQIEDEGLKPVQSPLMELSIAQGARNILNEAIGITTYLSPFHGGTTWWNGLGKRMDYELPSLRTPETGMDKSMQLVTEYFMPAGYMIKGSKLSSQLISGAADIKKYAGKFSRGEDIGAFTTAFGAVDFGLVDPNDANLAAMLQEHPKLQGPVNWYLDKLATDPDNPEWQNRFVRTVEGMGVGFAVEGALWLSKILGVGVKQGTIKVVKPLDQDLYNYMKTNMPEDVTFAQRVWGTLQDLNSKVSLKNFINKYVDDINILRYLEEEVDGVKPKLINLRDQKLLEEFQRLKNLPENKNISDEQLRAIAETNIGAVGKGGKSAWIEFKLLKNTARVVDNFINKGTSTWMSLDEAGANTLNYGNLKINGKGLANSIGDHIKTTTQLNDFMHYIVAKRALTLHKRGFKPEEILPNFDLNKLNVIAKQGDNSVAFQGALKDLQAYNKRLMDFAVDSGVISREAADKMLSKNPIYVPFYRVTETIAPEGVLQANLKQANKNKPYNKFGGSGEMIGNPWQSLLRNTSVIVEASLRNRANQTLADYLDKVVVKRKEKAILEAKKLYPGNKKKQTEFVNNFAFQWAEPITAKDKASYIKITKGQLKEQLEKQNIKDIKITDKEVDEYIKLLHFNSKNIRIGDDLLFGANINGELKLYKIKDELLKDAVDSFGWKSFEYQSWIMKGLRMNKGAVSWLITRDPSFAFYANPARDSMGGAISSTSWQRIPYYDSTIGAYKVWSYQFGKDKYNHEKVLSYLNNGGGHGTLYYGADEQYAQSLKNYFNKEAQVPVEDVITTPVDFKKFLMNYEKLIQVAEHATRLREYEKMLKMGYNEREAAVLAREISVDFSAKGSSSLIKGLNQSVAFLNPGIQGTKKSLETFFGRGKEGFGKAFIQTNLYIGTPSAYLWSLNHDNPDYLAYPDYVKRQAWFIPAGKRYDDALGREVTRFVLVPKPFDLFGWYANTVEAGLQAGYDYVYRETGDKEAASIFSSELLKTIWMNSKHALPPAPLPPTVSAGIALAFNYDSFTGANIVPQRLKGAPPEFQYTPWTSETVKAVSQATGLSPLKVESLYSKFLPGLGEKFLEGADLLTTAYSDKNMDAIKPPYSLENFPIFDRAYRNGVPRISQQELDAYERAGKGLEDIVSENLAFELLLSDEARLNKFLENDDNRERITQRPLFFSYLQQMAKINQQIRLIQSDEGRSNDSKNREILQLNDMKRKMAEEFLDATNFLQTSL